MRELRPIPSTSSGTVAGTTIGQTATRRSSSENTVDHRYPTPEGSGGGGGSRYVTTDQAVVATTARMQISTTITQRFTRGA